MGAHAVWVQSRDQHFFRRYLRQNSLKNGFLPISIPQEASDRLFAALAENPEAKVGVDLGNQRITLPDGSKVEFPIDDFSKACILAGVDELGFILSQEVSIAAFEKTRENTLTTTS